MNPTAAKNARRIQCRGCKEPLEIADATTLNGWYYCPKCIEHERQEIKAANRERKADLALQEPQQEKGLRK